MNGSFAACAQPSGRIRIIRHQHAVSLVFDFLASSPDFASNTVHVKGVDAHVLFIDSSFPYPFPGSDCCSRVFTVQRSVGELSQWCHRARRGELAVPEHLAGKGITHQTSCAHTPQQNGVSERANRVICERAIAIMHSERIPLSLWPQVIETVVFLKNRAPSRSVTTTPYQLLFNRKPSLRDLRVFGCTAYVLIRKGARAAKLADRAILCIFLGYSDTQKAWKFWDPVARKLVVSRDAIFDEHTSAARLGRPHVSLEDLERAMLGSLPRSLPYSELVTQLPNMSSHPPPEPQQPSSADSHMHGDNPGTAPHGASTRPSAQDFVDAVGDVSGAVGGGRSARHASSTSSVLYNRL
ncbi:hypothetical protein A1Q1_01119 [Trichosporon asahii var. asahii CBS 2479]|uniref:Integrase catalytic domain-containing protein n=1 Tax=Trichosporon asahii var. asahii (strain ATCC 90039 / CBS 2479 / JCM 2466 / KCTC 7840 / NBRC 103889/ NCYC 2677 / UAMH 7654) TaxID=1186058 RepID=J5TU27_TRIAS|nr:hypothetical protein A1Q1_01119 [Trichosporon asahii var. asahii CBS 2479]EJT52846.1 hypothetical protein A1Q1_01119 [Trichosporon asahii var. asahii CBS 2479]